MPNADSPASCPSPSPSSPAGAASPSSATKPILAGRHPPGHRPALRLQDGACGSCKCRMLEGRVIHGAHQQQGAAAAEEEAAGLILTCCAAPQTDIVIEARTVPGAGEFPVRKMPSRVLVDRQGRARRGDAARCSCRPTTPLQYHAGQYVEFILRDGARRSYSMANAPHNQGEQAADRAAPAPHARRQVHRPRLRRDEGKGDPARRGARSAASSCARTPTSRWCCSPRAPASRRSRRSSSTCSSEGSQRQAVLYWGCRARADLYMNDWAEEATRRMPNLRYVPVLSEPKPEDAWTGRTGFVHQAVMARPARPVGAPGLRLRRADHGRVGAARLHRPLRPAGRRVLRRLVHVGGRQARA